MSTATGRPGRRGREIRRGRSGQRGATLIELLVAIALGTLIVLPVLLWVGVVLRAQPLTEDGLLRTAHAGLLGTYFAADVQVGGAADDLRPGGHPVPAGDTTWAALNRDDCSGTDGAGGRRVAVVWSAGTDDTKTVYTVARMVEGGATVPSRWSLWRRECVASTGTLLSARQVLTDVVNTAAATSATCTSAQLPGGGAAEPPCRQLQLTATPRDGGRPVVLNATRRVDLAPPVAGPDGNLQPTVKIAVASRDLVDDGTPAVVLTLDGGGSTDPEDCPDGTAAASCPGLTYRWELPLGPEGSDAGHEVVEGGAAVRSLSRTFASVGLYSVRLRVTDAAGASNVAYKLIEVENRLPRPAPAVTPRTVRDGVDTIDMAAGISFDPDGQVVGWRWVLTGGPEGQDLLAELSGPTATYAVPVGASGSITVTLVLTDDLGGEASAALDVEVAPPEVPTDPGDPTGSTTTVPADPDAPVAAFTHAAGAGALQLDLVAQDVGLGVVYRWDFGLLAGPPTEGRIVSHTFPAAGTYQVALTVDDGVHAPSTARRAVVLEGPTVTPTGLRQEGTQVRWDAQPGVRRYLVDVEYFANGCASSLLDRPVLPSTTPSYELGPVLCQGVGAAAQVRVRAEHAPGVESAPTAWLVLSDPGAGP